MRGGAARAVTSQRIPRLQPNDPRRRTPTTPAGHASRGGDMRTRTRSPMPLFGPPLAAEHREGCMQTCTSPGHNRQLLTGGRQTQTDEATPETGSNRRHASRRRLPLSRAQHEYRGFRIALPTSRTDAVVGGATEGVRERPGAPGYADRSAVWATAGASCGASLQPHRLRRRGRDRSRGGNGLRLRGRDGPRCGCPFGSLAQHKRPEASPIGSAVNLLVVTEREAGIHLGVFGVIRGLRRQRRIISVLDGSSDLLPPLGACGAVVPHKPGHD